MNGDHKISLRMLPQCAWDRMCLDWRISDPYDHFPVHIVVTILLEQGSEPVGARGCAGRGTGLPFPDVAGQARCAHVVVCTPQAFVANADD